MDALDAKTAIVTGGASGIGTAIARRFAHKGAQIAVLDIDDAAAEATVEEIESSGGAAAPFPCDVSDQQSVDAAFEDVVRRFGSLDLLINNADISHVGTVETTTEEDSTASTASTSKACTTACRPAPKP